MGRNHGAEPVGTIQAIEASVGWVRERIDRHGALLDVEASNRRTSSQRL
jgi:hypothetical protein